MALQERTERAEPEERQETDHAGEHDRSEDARPEADEHEEGDDEQPDACTPAQPRGVLLRDTDLQQRVHRRLLVDQCLPTDDAGPPTDRQPHQEECQRPQRGIGTAPGHGGDGLLGFVHGANRAQLLVASGALLGADGRRLLVEFLPFQSHLERGRLSLGLGLGTRSLQFGARLLGGQLGGCGSGNRLLCCDTRGFGLFGSLAGLVVSLLGQQQPRIAGNCGAGPGQRRHRHGAILGRILRIGLDQLVGPGLLSGILDDGTHNLSSLSCVGLIRQLPSSCLRHPNGRTDTPGSRCGGSKTQLWSGSARVSMSDSIASSGATLCSKASLAARIASTRRTVCSGVDAAAADAT